MADLCPWRIRMDWLGFLSYILSTAYTPGPNNLASMSNAARAGLKKGIKFNFGIYTAQIVMSVTVALFCSVLSRFIDSAMLPMKIAGSLYILWLACKTFKGGSLDSKGTDGSFWSGFTLCLLNVKYLLMIVVSMELYVLPAYPGSTLAAVCFALIIATIGFSAHFTWAVCGGALKNLFEKHGKVMNTVFALMLVWCAVKMLM